jgi:Lipocalin-like domain
MRSAGRASLPMATCSAARARSGSPQVAPHLAYSGPYRVDETRRTVEHGMAISLFPNWQGQRQLRIPELNGDILVLATEQPMLFAGSLKTARITWRRATANL